MALFGDGGSRKYRRSNRPSFNFGFSSSSTIRDTGKGSATRYTTKSNRGAGPRSYEDIVAECQENGCLWEDPDYLAVDASLYHTEAPGGHTDLEWKRPGEICEDPMMFVDGATRMDVNQGVLGDCWLLAAVACLSTNDTLLKRVVPEQVLACELTGEYCGVLKFNFWQYGRWVEVLIDDRLPVVGDKLIYMHSDERNEFWSALLEKAYAKLHACYENMNGGLTSEALTDFTGGLIERFVLEEFKTSRETTELLERMLKAKKLGSLMGCSIDATPGNMEAQLDNGLIIGHAYSVTDVRKVEIETPNATGLIPMVRVRNPWGNECEWNGQFSDSCPMWEYIPDEEKVNIGLVKDHDGENWMTFKDFHANFMRLEICYLGPDSAVEGLEEGEEEEMEAINKWDGVLEEGQWVKYTTAGGCTNFPKSFSQNPQFRINVPEPDDDDEDGKVTVTIGLMQKDRRKIVKGDGNHAIGYIMYKVDDEYAGKQLGPEFFTSHRSEARSAFINMREVCTHHQLDPASYVLVPSTFDPNLEAHFILRIFTEKPKELQALDEHIGACDEAPKELADASEEVLQKIEECLDKFRETAGADGEVDAFELASILNELFADESGDGFSLDMCRSMVALKDADLSGRLDYRDFSGLLEDLKICKRAYVTFDQDSGGISGFELRMVLQTLGLRVGQSTLNAIIKRYANQEGNIMFDDFVALVIKMKALWQTFTAKDRDGEGHVEFEADEFIQMSVYS